MNPIAIGIVVFACTFGGALAGIKLHTMLPGHHLSDESRGTVNVGIGYSQLSSVIPGRAAGASPESMLTDRGYGFRARRFAPSRKT